MPKYSTELIEQAVAIAAASGAKEASIATGVPPGTIRSWLHRLRNADEPKRKDALQRCVATRPPKPKAQRNAKPREQRRTPQMTALTAEVQQRAIDIAAERVAESITDRLTRMADKLYTLAENATAKVAIAIADPEELPKGKHAEPHDRDGAAWVRALVGVMAQAIDKAQLLSGKPTARPEVSQRHEYHIVQEIVAQRPELLDTIFAEDQQQGMAHRSG